MKKYINKKQKEAIYIAISFLRNLLEQGAEGVVRDQIDETMTNLYSILKR